MRYRTKADDITAGALGIGLAAGLAITAGTAPGQALGDQNGPFHHVATFQVFENTDEDTETVAEIVSAAREGTLLVYTDSVGERVGFVDITEPDAPRADGVVEVSGEPTSVAVAGRYALAVVNTSPDFAHPSGELDVIDIVTRKVVTKIDLGGQPDSIAVSPNRRYAAVAIENERNEELGSGALPQAPAGFVVIVDLIGQPTQWSTRTVELVGIPELFPSDPEPEFIDINGADVAVCTLQENNHVVLIRLADGAIVDHFSTGTVDLDGIDTAADGVVELTGSLRDVRREPDAVGWTSLQAFATANEGDLVGGSRGFTVWDTTGQVLFDAGNQLEQTAARLGRYPERRADSKGCEPEAIEFGQYDRDRFLFVGAERANLVFVYELSPDPFLRQVLPVGIGPEGLLAIPERGLLVVANEVDDPVGGNRASLMIFRKD